MQTFKHNCIKCSVEYSDDDPDPYYCNACKEQNKILAAEIDKKMANRPKETPKSDLQLFNELSKGARGGFVNIKDLGITL